MCIRDSIEADPNGCIGCGKCDRACPMSLPVQDLLAGGAVADAECIQCAACADVCPKGVLRPVSYTHLICGARMVAWWFASRAIVRLRRSSTFFMDGTPFVCERFQRRL